MQWHAINKKYNFLNWFSHIQFHNILQKAPHFHSCPQELTILLYPDRCVNVSRCLRVKMFQCQWDRSYTVFILSLCDWLCVYVSVCQSYNRKCVNDHEAGPHLTKTLLSKVINLLLGSEESSERSWPVAAGGFNN